MKVSAIYFFNIPGLPKGLPIYETENGDIRMPLHSTIKGARGMMEIDTYPTLEEAISGSTNEEYIASMKTTFGEAKKQIDAAKSKTIAVEV